MDIIDKIQGGCSKRKAKKLIEDAVYNVLTKYQYKLDCALAKGSLFDEPPVELFREIAKEVK